MIEKKCYVCKECGGTMYILTKPEKCSYCYRRLYSKETEVKFLAC